MAAYVSTIVSGAASLGVLLGLISGIFFLVLTALRWVTRVRASLYEEELRRQKRYLINSRLTGTGVGESRKPENGFASHSNRLERIDENLQSNTTERTTQWEEHEVDENVSDKQDPTTDTIKVRELIEKMVETMIEGPLDGTTVGQLSTHSAWKNAMETDSTDLTKSNLERLIKRIVSEAMALPNIKEIFRPPRQSRAAIEEDFKNKSYEDILATAILNKVIENHQNKNYSDAIDGNPKPRLRRKKVRRTEEKSDDDDWSDTSRSDQLSLTIEEYIEEVTTAVEGSDDDKSESSDYELVTNRRIPFPESGRTVVDAGTDDENSDFEEPNTATELITSSNSWEENWLFQKKRLRSTPNAHHPVPVPMLVPNPSEDFRALVGGVDADDLSDLSECDLEELITSEETPLLVEAQPEIVDMPYEEEIREEEERREEVKEREEQEREVKEREVKEREVKEREVKEREKVQEREEVEERQEVEEREEVEESTKREAEVRQEEKNVAEELLEELVANVQASTKEKCDDDDDSNPKGVVDDGEEVSDETLPDVLAQKDRESSIVDFSHQYESLGSTSPSERTRESDESTIKCRLAEREREKWSSPISLPENPYSLENIMEKSKKTKYFRIETYTGEYIDFPEDLSSDELSRNDTDKIRFSRDYYINASKHPAGTPSPKRPSQVFWQKVKDEAPEEKRLIGEMEKPESPKPRVVDKREFRLPSVKELAKHFTRDEKPEPQTKPAEVDYSTVPVSEIILNLQQPAETPVRERDFTYGQPTQMEIRRKVDGKVFVEKPQEPVRFNGKQVHSLTARSISKEFREGLKNSSYQRNYQRVDRSSSGGESDQGEVVSGRMSTSPTPSIDLKNMKKFWETIITANANATKQK